MALKDIIARIEADARAKSESILQEARERASQLLEEGREDARAEAQRILARAQQQAQAQTSHLLTLSRLEGRRQVLEAKQEALQTAFTGALERLSQLEDGTYLQLLKRAVLAHAVSGTEKMVVNARDRQRITPDFVDQLNAQLREQGHQGNVTLAEETAAIAGGCILRGRELEINASFDAVLKTVRDELEPEIAGHLFGHGS